MFPELASEIDTDAFSPYALFFILLPFAHVAHRNGDDDALRRVYGYAQWCHHQRHGSELPNAVAVAFYEHLFDNWGLREQIASWLSPKVASDIWPLWQQRLDADQLIALRALMPDESAKAPWRGLRRQIGA